MSVPNQCCLLIRSALSSIGHTFGSFVKNSAGAIAISTKIATVMLATQKRLSRLSLRQTSPHRVSCLPPAGIAIASVRLAGLTSLSGGGNRSLIADPRVDPCAEQVHEQVGEDEDDRRQGHEPDDERSVLGLDPLDE